MEERVLMKKFLTKLWKDEEGQSMTEYLLMLAIVVMIVLKFKAQFQSSLLNAVSTVGGQIDSAVTSQ